MTYREAPSFVHVHYGIRIPNRDGKPLSGTEPWSSVEPARSKLAQSNAAACPQGFKIKTASGCNRVPLKLPILRTLAFAVGPGNRT